MSLNTTYLESNGTDITYPIPDSPGYVPPDVPTPGVPEPSILPNIPRPIFTSNIELDLYYNSSDNRKLNKTLSNKKVINTSLKETTDLINPSIILESDNDLTRYNYGYIKELGRYYYINAKKLDNNKMYVLLMTQDHLMTYRNSILNLVCIIDKQETRFNDLLEDGSHISQVDDFTNTYYFLSSNNQRKGFNATPTNILICAGGAASLFEGGSVSLVNSEHVTITASQSRVLQDEVLYITPEVSAGYRVKKVEVHVDIPGGSTFDITDSYDYWGQYSYISAEGNPVTVTVTEEAV